MKCTHKWDNGLWAVLFTFHKDWAACIVCAKCGDCLCHLQSMIDIEREL